MNFLHTFLPQPILFEIGSLKVHWYGLFMMVAIFTGIAVVTSLAKKYGIKKDDVYDLAFYVVIFGLVGARIYAVLLFPAHYFSNPLEIVQVWKGGLAIHGAIIGGILALLWHCKKKKMSFWLWADLIVPALALGQAIGRWGNYFNQELYGMPTTLPWGIPIAPENRVLEFQSYEFFHPTFLYESILNLAVFGVLIGLHYFRIKNPLTLSPSPQGGEGGGEGKTLQIPSSKFQEGNIALLYLILYSIIRITMEQFRVDETPIVFGIRLPVLVSFIILAAAYTFHVKKTFLGARNKV